MKRSAIWKFSRRILCPALALALLPAAHCASGSSKESRADELHPPAGPAAAAACKPHSRAATDPIYTRLNRLRAARRVGPLLYDQDLARAAHRFARELARRGELSHRDGPSQRLARIGLVRRSVAENLARFLHRTQPRDYVLKDWLEGDQEAMNMLSPRQSRVGFGIYPTPTHCYATLILTD